MMGATSSVHDEFALDSVSGKTRPIQDASRHVHIDLDLCASHRRRKVPPIRLVARLYSTVIWPT